MKRSIRLIGLEANALHNLFYAGGRTKYVATVVFISTPLIASARIRVKIDSDVLSDPIFWYVILIILGIILGIKVVVVALNLIFKYIVALIKKVLTRDGNIQGSGCVENMKAYGRSQAQNVLDPFVPDDEAHMRVAASCFRVLLIVTLALIVFKWIGWIG